MNNIGGAGRNSRRSGLVSNSGGSDGAAARSNPSQRVRQSGVNEPASGGVDSPVMPLDCGFYYAVRCCVPETIESYMSLGIDINATCPPGFECPPGVDNSGFTALHIAVQANRPDVVKLLLEKNADVRIRDRLGHESLHIAVAHAVYDGAEAAENWISVIGHLLAHNADINVKCARKTTALFSAITCDNFGISKYLVDAKANVNAYCRLKDMPLAVAISKGSTQMVRLLLDAEADVNHSTGLVASPLHIATIFADSTIVELLLAARANVNAVDNDGLSPVLVSINKKRTEITRILINERGALGQTELYQAVAQPNNAYLGTLLENKADVNKGTSSQVTPLHRAVQEGNLAMVARLINSKADVTRTDNKQNSVLHFWANFCDSWTDNQRLSGPILKKLIEAGVNLNAPNHVGLTPLHIAVMKNNEMAVELLTSRSASVDCQESDFARTPLHIAAREGYAGIVAKLIDAKAPIALIDNRGKTPLALATNYHHDACRLLLEPDPMVAAMHGIHIGTDSEGAATL